MITETFPVVLAASAAGGYAVGTAADFFAQHKHDQTARPINETLPNAVPEHSSRRKLSRIVSAIGGLGMATGVFLGLAIEGQPQPTQVATVEVVVDRSGGTTKSYSGESALGRENAFIKQLSSNSKMKTEFFSSKLDDFSVLNADQVIKETPYGGANLLSAVNAALKKTAGVNSSYVNKKNSRNTGIVVLTNGNGIGKTDNVPDITKAAAVQGQTPIFVLNVRSKNSDPKIVTDLQKIAKDTGGEYWDTKSKDSDKIINAISKTIQPSSEERPADHHNRPAFLVLAAASLLLGGVGLKRNASVHVSNVDKRK